MTAAGPLGWAAAFVGGCARRPPRLPAMSLSTGGAATRQRRRRVSAAAGAYFGRTRSGRRPADCHSTERATLQCRRPESGQRRDTGAHGNTQPAPGDAPASRTQPSSPLRGEYRSGPPRNSLQRRTQEWDRVLHREAGNSHGRGVRSNTQQNRIHTAAYKTTV